MIITTNIRLPEEQWKALKIMAVHAGTSVSELLRRAVRGLLAGASVPPAPKAPAGPRNLKRVKDPFFDAVGIGEGGPSDDSVRHDRYLYGRK